MSESAPARPRAKAVNTWPHLAAAGVLLALWFAWRTLSAPGAGRAFDLARASGNLDFFLAGWLGHIWIGLILVPLIAGALMTTLLGRYKENKPFRNLGVMWLFAVLGTLAPFALVGAGLLKGW